MAKWRNAPTQVVYKELNTAEDVLEPRNDDDEQYLRGRSQPLAHLTSPVLTLGVLQGDGS